MSVFHYAAQHIIVLVEFKLIPLTSIFLLFVKDLALELNSHTHMGKENELN